MRLRLPLFSYAVTRTMAFTPRAAQTLRGVVFDMDGTLTKPNLDFEEMCTSPLCAPPVDTPHMSEDILGAVAAMPPAERAAATAVIDEMEAEGRRTLAVMPGAVELVRWLHAHEVPTALVTRNTRATVAHLHDALWAPRGLAPFAPAISRDDELPAKPDPAALARIASAWGAAAPSGELLMVGDSPANDVAFGKAAGAATALLDSGRRTVEGGADGGADLVVHRLASLPRALFERFEIGSALAGPLRKYPTPAPQSAASRAAAAGDAAALAAMALDECDARDGDGGNTPLVWAADAGHARAVEALLGKGVAVNTRGYLGATACARAPRGPRRRARRAARRARLRPERRRTTRCRARSTSPRSSASPRRSSSCSPRRPATCSCSTARAARPPRTRATRRSAPAILAAQDEVHAARMSAAHDGGAIARAPSKKR